MGRFMKPDSQFGSPYNPQGFNLYSYVRGDPVNFNDPLGHERPGRGGARTVDPIPDFNDSFTIFGQTWFDQMGVNAVINAENIVNDLIANNGVAGSYSVSPDVLNALENDSTFRAGFTMWLSTDIGLTQFEDMRGDENTHYLLGFEPINGATGETDPDYGHRNNDSAGMDYKTVNIWVDYNKINANHTDADERAFFFAETLGHEGFHAEMNGSGKYTSLEVGQSEVLLDHASGAPFTYPPYKAYDAELRALPTSEQLEAMGVPGY
jgi:hypothetical protein